MMELSETDKKIIRNIRDDSGAWIFLKCYYGQLRRFAKYNAKRKINIQIERKESNE